MIYGSICSGIESATAAWHPLGWRAAFCAEIEPFPSAVLAHHYPGVPNLGDITQYEKWPDADIDVLVGGTPCQSFSVAGLRKGLDDPRGNLMLTYLAIARRYRPTWVVWENVPGVLSSGGGQHFGTFLAALGQLGYGWAYRVLDAQYFNLAQRRARVFVVGCLGGWAGAAAVLFERASLSGHPAPSRETRENIAGTLTRSAFSGSACGGDGRDELMVAGTLQHSGKAAGSATQQDAECGLLIAHSLRGEGFDASEDGTGRGTPLIPVIANTLTGGARKRGGYSGDPAHETMICFDETQITSAENRCNPQPGDPSHPLGAGASPPTIAFDSRQDPCDYGNVAGALSAMSPQSQAVAFQSSQSGDRIHATSATLDANMGSRRRSGIVSGMQVRRLTPRECERLQGFPDDYTLIPYRGKPAKDSPRYKALGNSKAVPVVRWIGQRIQVVDDILNEKAA